MDVFCLALFVSENTRVVWTKSIYIVGYTDKRSRDISSPNRFTTPDIHCPMQLLPRTFDPTDIRFVRSLRPPMGSSQIVNQYYL